MDRIPDPAGARGRQTGARAPNFTPSDQDAPRMRQERLLDEGLEETFPASDPVAVVRLT